MSQAVQPHSPGNVTRIIKISKKRARQLAVMGQLLDADRPSSLVSVVKRLGFVQMDPTAAVARTEHLVLWSRIGNSFQVNDLNEALYKKRTLYEHRAFIYPTSDYLLHRARMIGWPQGDSSWPRAVREWLHANERFSKYVLSELKRRGPLRSRDFEDRSVIPWRSSGWNNDRNVGMMLEFLWGRGEIGIDHRRGNERWWNIAERIFPSLDPSVSPEEAQRKLSKRRLRSLGVARSDGSGVGVPVEIQGVTGQWVASPDLLDKEFKRRTAILSPFDRLVYDRQRLLDLFDFEYKLEIYVPVSQRRWGYYVLPILRGDRLVAKADARADYKELILRVPVLHLEEGAKAVDISAAEFELQKLAKWLGTERVVIDQVRD